MCSPTLKSSRDVEELSKQAQGDHTCFAKIIDPVLVLDNGWRDSGRVDRLVILGNVIKQISISKIDGCIREVGP